MPNIHDVIFVITVVLLLRHLLCGIVLDFTLPQFNHRVCIPDRMSLQLSPLSDNPRQWIEDAKTHLREASAQTKKAGTEYVNYRALYALGQYNEDESLYFPSSMTDPATNQNYAQQDPTKFTKVDAKKLAKHLPDTEITLLELHLQTPAWTNAGTHLQLQTELRGAIDGISLNHPLIGPRYARLQDQVQDPGDFYQGSRAVANMYQAMSDYLEHEQLHLQRECGDLILALRATEPMSVDAFVTAVREVQRYIWLFNLAEVQNADSLYTLQLVAAVKYSQNLHIVKAVTSPNEPTNIEALVQRLRQLPLNTATATGFSASVFTAVSKAVQSVASLATSGTVPPVSAPISCPDGFVPKRKFDEIVRSRDRIRQTAISLGISPEALRKPPPEQPRGGREVRASGSVALEPPVQISLLLPRICPMHPGFPVMTIKSWRISWTFSRTTSKACPQTPRTNIPMLMIRSGTFPLSKKSPIKSSRRHLRCRVREGGSHGKYLPRCPQRHPSCRRCRNRRCRRR